MFPADTPPLPAPPPVRWVLDTNVVLDWLVFANTKAQLLGQAIAGGTAQWLVSARMLEEFEWVMQRGLHVRYGTDPQMARNTWQRHATLCDEPAPTTAPRLRCRDPSDQIFLDLALTAGAQVLWTHDRALLALKRRAAALGLRIATPGPEGAPATRPG